MVISDPVVVIGGGPTGAVAARELIGAGIDVVMLDAGGEAPRGIIVRAADKTVLRWVQGEQLAYNRHRAAKDPRTIWFSSLSFGGLTNYWTGAVPRLAPEDFTDGARLDERYAWPIGYDDLESFYGDMEDLMEVTAGDGFANVPTGRRARYYRLPADWRALAAAASENGDSLAAMPIAKGAAWMIALRGTPFNSYHCVVKPLVRSGRLRLVSHAYAVDLGTDKSGRRVDRVRYLDRETGELHWIGARAVIVAAGTLDSTELLLRAASSGLPDGLGDGGANLGRYLHDHPREWWPIELATPITAPPHPICLTRGPYEDAEPLRATHITIGLPTSLARLRTWFRGTVSRLGVQVFATMIPDESQCLTLEADDDRLDQSRLCIQLTYDDATLATLTSSRNRLAETFSRAGWRAIVDGPFHDVSPGASVHYGGTARMHHSPKFGVVDRWNRVHGISNLLVSDASCFTTCPEKNPTLTAMAISARAARHLAAELA